MDIQDQLAHLRRTVATIQPRGMAAAAGAERSVQAGFVEDLLSGEVVETPAGKHFETETHYARHKRYGSYDISDLNELPDDFNRSRAASRASVSAGWRPADGSSST